MSIVEHIEKNFGKISKGWSFSEDAHPYQIVECRDGSVEGVVSFCTLGLSNVGLKSAVSPQIIFHELLLSVDQHEVPKNAVAIVKQFADDALASNYALLNNQLVQREGVVFENHLFSAVWVKPPVFFGDESFSHEGVGRDDVSCIFAWLVPIFDSELGYIKDNGADAFEALLENSSVDVFSLSRKSVVD
ncbi:suppressor of fused domain protein [Pseudomonas sp. MPR-ANC1]|uniref:suppressor of fused domain protein n=1 Tax=Pseudomonas sp. MPR-ANC1 TaxID=2075548 RepID=UPI001304CAF0|nr:suppressor of fused domain protein [Pseudomonas sp. MPR-ANC1]